LGTRGWSFGFFTCSGFGVHALGVEAEYSDSSDTGQTPSVPQDNYASRSATTPTPNHANMNYGLSNYQAALGLLEATKFTKSCSGCRFSMIRTNFLRACWNIIAEPDIRVFKSPKGSTEVTTRLQIFRDDKASQRLLTGGWMRRKKSVRMGLRSVRHRHRVRPSRK
jgi:hypothetical protein